MTSRPYVELVPIRHVRAGHSAHLPPRGFPHEVRRMPQACQGETMFDTSGEAAAVPAVADEFFVLCHDEHSGRSRLHAEAMGLGLAGGLLAELALAGHVDVVQGRLIPTSRHGVPADPLAHQVHRLLQLESHTLPDWLQYLAGSARERVGTRLVDAGVVRRVQRRGLLRPAVRYPALDADRAAWTAGRLRALMLHGLRTGRGDRGIAAVGTQRCADWMVIALAAATELAPHVLLWSRDVPLARLSWVFEALPPPLRSLARHTQQAVAQIAFTGI